MSVFEEFLGLGEVSKPIRVPQGQLLDQLELLN
jgi:hypothetical protein